jgi:REP element-mobilizing transposase RayT
MVQMKPGSFERPCGTHQTRVGRHSDSGQIYHIIASTRDRYPHFSSFTRGRFVVKALIRMDSVSLATTLAFVVMPDHLHWLMRLHSNRNLSVCVGNVKSLSARLLNESLDRKGPIWQRGFFDCAIRRECDLVSLSRYIVANPLRAKLVEQIGDYPLWDAIWMNQSCSNKPGTQEAVAAST